MYQQVRFADKGRSAFFATVRKRVDNYFIQNNISKHANAEMILKTVLFLGGFAGFYLLLLLGNFSTPVMLLLAAAIGVFGALIGFNICHDAIHGSYSSNMYVNKALSLVFNIIGANPYVWSISHNIVHHTYTNIAGHDEDIEVAPGLIRLSPEDKLTPIQRYQHLYAFLLYGLASVSWVFRKDFKKFFQEKIGSHKNRHPKMEYFNLFFYKGVYYFLFIALPLWIMPISFGGWLAGFMVMHISQGLVLGLVFQLAHVVEGTDFPLPDENGNMEESWAAHQMRTTANFARNSRIANFLCGGLNMQIEHHLFPKICHVHYAAIAPIVQQTAKEFDLPYIENETFFSALQSHYRMLRKFGIEEWEAKDKLVMA
ncbi:fatty acid desaturase family protein [Rhodoflexus sp.]